MKNQELTSLQRAVDSLDPEDVDRNIAFEDADSRQKKFDLFSKEKVEHGLLS